MPKIISLAIIALSLTGCATTEYKEYADAQTQIHVARAQADKARYEALANVAQSGTESAKVAAVMALALGGTNGQAQQGPQVQAPQASSALQWAAVLVPGVSQMYAISQSTRLGMAQSDNSTALGVSTNSAFVGIAGKIQAPAANVTSNTTSTSTSTILSGTGVLGAGTYSTFANPTTTTTTTTTNPAGQTCSVDAAGVVNCK